MAGSSGLDTQPLHFTEFSPATQGTALFGSLSNASLSSVTSVSLVRSMPEGGVSSSLTAAICSLLEGLPRVERMHLCPSGLALEVLRRLNESLELCPELRKLRVAVTAKTHRMITELVVGGRCEGFSVYALWVHNVAKKRGHGCCGIGCGRRSTLRNMSDD